MAALPALGDFGLGERANVGDQAALAADRARHDDLGIGALADPGADAEIIVAGPTGRERCMVTDVRALTPDEIAANRRHH